MSDQNQLGASALPQLWKNSGASVLSLLFISGINFLTGSELSLIIFYFIPIAMCAWHQPGRSVLWLAALCGVSWGLADYFSGHQYSHPAFRFWNAFICAAACAVFGIALQRLRRNLDELAQEKARLTCALADLQKHQHEVHQLKSNAPVVCAWTERIRVEDQWMTLSEFLTQRLHWEISHGISPLAHQKIMQSLNTPDRPPTTTLCGRRAADALPRQTRADGGPRR
jgi:hypothetical protein